MTDDHDREPDDAPDDAFEPVADWRTDAERLDAIEDDICEMQAGMLLLADRIGRLRAEGRGHTPDPARRPPATTPTEERDNR